ncbi:sigma-70 family RNA polymerase sigma factor [Rhodococcus triatomae]|uniref:RNA polymerase sigma-70 factor, ECF subfamily n=1 Tax=Rhodococcus triatomae TaxID=300028 RepID=A0A1G8H5D0_9NOCA|nr:sigma-70 family RNA polymerase sigma factor [Rhodococcus triatomae]QNG20204.1 sigma-70 family RNA polymerase sigma factor [Rhodococcus triatomae]QNG23881.1 sigma-70 family RNA polymerase sigma factor [Rhodococcus triatomae]SDI01730.1 RNA polymerase sigma-70 factor, ECF subfamily [Rhodococcus triatomae]
MTTASTAPAYDEEFLQLAEPYRRELLAHCYRMMGSLQDAEDQLQETMLRAWKGYGGYKKQASLRTWLHRIATNTCLTALNGSSMRPLPSGLGSPESDPDGDLVERHEVPWLSPIPDRMLEREDDPASVVTSRESVRLAFIAALQHLPPRQRATLILRDVLQWKAAEVADAVGSSTQAVNSLLQRARAQLHEAMPREETLVEPDSPEAREQLERYVAAFENYDVDAIVSMFTEDAVWEMPPFDGWYRGGPAIGQLIAGNCPADKAGDMRLLPTSSNGQPALGLYMRGEDGVHRPFQIQILELTTRGVGHVVTFFDTGLFDLYGLPPVLTD